MNEIQCPDNRGTERDSSLPLQDYHCFYPSFKFQVSSFKFY
ncbi:Uncharacterized protein dnm_014910 [Desulfonema magnum]|uniref:Uncharacterized protein n=1 Tax=Desulfonema magnum TaxID=45655 RepID=A0A975BI46_9BACT|nr:Uncharacterized protein dnm_014910 [Desulfonema magnum]